MVIPVAKPQIFERFVCYTIAILLRMTLVMHFKQFMFHRDPTVIAS